MMTKCPECSSNEIIPDLVVFSDQAASAQQPLYVKLMEPEPAKRPFVWMPKSEVTGFYAAICGACGHTEFYTKRHAEILKAYRDGYKPETFSMNIIPF